MKRIPVLCAVFALGGMLLSADLATPTPQKGQKERGKSAARSYLTELFPRTRGLLGYLAQNDPKTHAKLLEHSNALLEKAQLGAERFVEQHHPELAAVLADLETRKHPSFRRAMGDVVRDVTRLSQVKQRVPNAYPAAVDAWKHRSRIRLRGARIALRKSGGSVEELRELVRDVQAAERRETQARIDRMQAQIERLQKKLDVEPETAVERELDSIRKKIQRRRRGQ